MFVPFLNSRAGDRAWGSGERDSARSFIGFSSSYSLVKISSVGEVVQAYYAGLRAAQSKTRYFDISYGKVEGVRGGRVRFTGQLPVLNRKAVAGVEINIAADNKIHEADDLATDTVKLYVMTEVDLTQILKGFGSQ